MKALVTLFLGLFLLLTAMVFSGCASPSSYQMRCADTNLVHLAPLDRVEHCQKWVLR